MINRLRHVEPNGLFLLNLAMMVGTAFRVSVPTEETRETIPYTLTAAGVAREGPLLGFHSDCPDVVQ